MMFTNNEHNDGLAHGEPVAQNADFVQFVQRPASDVGVPEVASGSPVSTLSNTSENKPEGVNLPAAAEGEPSAEAESGSSAATKLNLH